MLVCIDAQKCNLKKFTQWRGKYMIQQKDDTSSKSSTCVSTDIRPIVVLNPYLCNSSAEPQRDLAEAINEYQEDLMIKNNNFWLDSLHASSLLEYSNTISNRVLLQKISFDAELLFDKIAHDNPDIFLSCKGRIKCLVEVEKKLNMLIYKTPEHVKKQRGKDAVPEDKDYINSLQMFKDTLGFRYIFDGLPEEELLKRINSVANILIKFMITLGYTPEIANRPISTEAIEDCSLKIDENYLSFFKDYISNPKENGYQSLHIVFRHTASGRFVEFQFRTMKQHVEAEYGKAHHNAYKENRYNSNVIAYPEISRALKRAQALEKLDLTKVNIRGFATYTELLQNDFNTTVEKDVAISDHVGLIKPRLLLEREKI